MVLARLFGFLINQIVEIKKYKDMLVVLGVADENHNEMNVLKKKEEKCIRLFFVNGIYKWGWIPVLSVRCFEHCSLFGLVCHCGKIWWLACKRPRRLVQIGKKHEYIFYYDIMKSSEIE